MNHNLHIRFAMEPVKWLLGSDVGADYLPLADVNGDTLIASPGRQILVQNGTDGDVMISIDGITDHVPVFKGSFILLDIAANKEGPSEMFDMAKGTIIYAIQLNAAGGGDFADMYTDPTVGAVFATLIYAQ